MRSNPQNPNHQIRENFLLSLLNKCIKEYKALVEFTRKSHPFKIVEIITLSKIPGETIFLIQLTNKDCTLQVSAADLINKNYNLNQFSDYHAEMIRKAAQGKLIEFLKLLDKNTSNYKIVSKKYDRNNQQYIFTIETNDDTQLTCTAEELSKNKNLLVRMDFNDIYDIGYTQGTESILKEKTALLLAKRR